VESDHQQAVNNDSADMVKVILNLDRQMENNEPQWDELKKSRLWISINSHYL
jgi:hypothetical protein